ncbi:drebrin-like protein B [Homarus americanus]|uniref:drebrin-like protein B n=1 Tax=Homarus americanus TaxID=6706 RepID=UPI001C43DF0C|nr:drebrin-like protein B [Homarus americanus]
MCPGAPRLYKPPTMSIDVEKNRNSILKAFNDVVSDKTATDWALFGYEGQTNTLKVIGTGEDGLEELADDLNSSKIMYAVVKVIDPNTTRPKNVLINWQGEGAPTVRKGTCARHLHDIHKLLRGVHVTVNARTEEEVEPEVVMAAVLKLSATTYNFNERSEMNDKTTPVLMPSGASGPAVACGDGSQTFPSIKPKPKMMKRELGTNYKRTNPLAEIDSKSRNKFWEEQEAEERRRKFEEQQRKDEELKNIETERKKRELTDAQHREQLTRQRNARILAERKAEENAAQHLAAQQDQKWQQDIDSQHQEEAERAKRSEMMRLERKKEAETLIGQRTHSTRDMFESGITNSKQATDKNRPPPRRLKEFKPVNSQSSREEGKENNPSAPSRGVAARWPPASSEPPQQLATPTQRKGDVMSPALSTNVSTPQQNTIPDHSSPPAPPTKQPPETSHPQPEVNNTGYVRNLLRDGLPTQPVYDTEEPAAMNVWEEASLQEAYHGPPPPEPPVHNTNGSNQTYHHLPSIPSLQQESSLNQSSLYPSSQHPTSPHQEDPVTYQAPSFYTNVDGVPHIYQVTAEESLKANHHNGTQDKHMYGHTDETTPTKAASKANSIYDTAVHQSNSTNATTTPVGGQMCTPSYNGMEYQILPEHGLCARALYDYQAADDTEITFDPAEIITNIDQIDEGWWQGVGPDGMFGLFPANYVELINQSPV